MKDIPKKHQNVMFVLLILPFLVLKKIRHRLHYDSSFSIPRTKQSSRPNHSILKFLGYRSGNQNKLDSFSIPSPSELSNSVLGFTMTSPALWFIFQNNDLLLLQHNSLPTDIELEGMSSHFLRCFSLGAHNQRQYHCAEVSERVLVTDVFQRMPLKTALSVFGPALYRLIVKARSIVTWDKNHQFCSCCGAGTVVKNDTFERLCQACDLSFFPRISPSIIVLIQKEDQVLMARSPHFAPGVYALIAGFVEAGESVEETVHREVFEEVGIRIKNLSYFGSQSWPFPDSLMIAFKADYASGDIVIDKEEIEAAGWYRYDNLPGRPSTPVSISSILLDDYIRSASEKYGE